MCLVGIDYFRHILLWRGRHPQRYMYQMYFGYIREVLWLFLWKTIFKFSPCFRIQGEHLSRVIIQNAMFNQFSETC
jgi:hypothetical protein